MTEPLANESVEAPKVIDHRGRILVAFEPAVLAELAKAAVEGLPQYRERHAAPSSPALIRARHFAEGAARLGDELIALAGCELVPNAGNGEANGSLDVPTARYGYDDSIGLVGIVDLVTRAHAAKLAGNIDARTLEDNVAMHVEIDGVKFFDRRAVARRYPRGATRA